MATLRQLNLLAQERIDLPILRMIESAVSADFDILAGLMMSGRAPLVLRGFNILTANTAGNPAINLVLNVASGLLMSWGASESGTIFKVSDTQAQEILNSTNPSVVGSFTAGVTNYVGLDLYRSADPTTSDLAAFLDADTLLEISETVPLARILKYRIVITTQNFTASPNLVPIAKIVTDSGNNVVSITDSRPMMFRLGSGGDPSNPLNVYPWGTRTENPVIYTTSGSSPSTLDPFSGEDKSINSLKQWIDSIMSRIWDIGSGEHWYSKTTRDNVKLAYGQPVLVANNDNFYFDGTNLSWSGLVVLMENSTASVNSVQTSTVAYGGPIAFPDGSCLYVDIQRSTQSATLTPIVTTLMNLGTPNIPGSRFILAWRNGAYVFTRDRPYEVGRTFSVATTSQVGLVKLSSTATTPTAPIVISDGGGTITPQSNLVGLTITGFNSGSGGGSIGLLSTGGSSTSALGADGARFTGGAGGGAFGGGAGVKGTGGIGGSSNIGGIGGVFTGGSPGGTNLTGAFGLTSTGSNGNGTGVGGNGGVISGGSGGTLAGGGIGLSLLAGDAGGGNHNGGISLDISSNVAGNHTSAAGAGSGNGGTAISIYGGFGASTGDGPGGATGAGGIGITVVGGPGGASSGAGGNAVMADGGTAIAGNSNGGNGVIARGGVATGSGKSGWALAALGPGIAIPSATGTEALIAAGAAGQNGITSYGGSGHTGITATGGSGASGVVALAGTGYTGAALNAIAQSGGTGTQGSGGVVGAYGSGTTYGVEGVGNGGSSIGVYGTSTNISIQGAPIVPASASTPQIAFQANGGYLDWTTTAAPGYDVTFTHQNSNPNNTVVAAANFTGRATDGGINPNSGYNISSIAQASNVITINWLPTLSNISYVVQITIENPDHFGSTQVVIPKITARSTTSVSITYFNLGPGGDPGTNGTVYNVTILNTQPHS